MNAQLTPVKASALTIGNVISNGETEYRVASIEPKNHWNYIVVACVNIATGDTRTSFYLHVDALVSVNEQIA